MFFNTKRSPRKTTHQTLSTEQLEQKAMFSVSPVEPVVALDVGPVNQTGYEFQAKDVALVKTYCSGYCFADTDGFMKIGEIRTESGLRAHPGGEGSKFGDIMGEVGGVFESPHGTYFESPHGTYIEGLGGAGKQNESLFEKDCSRVAGSFGPGGTSYMTGEDGRMIVHPQFNVGNNVLAQANQQPSLTAIRDVDIASESIGGSADPGGDDIFMPKPNRTDVWTNGSATSLAPRHVASAMMGR